MKFVIWGSWYMFRFEIIYDGFQKLCGASYVYVSYLKSEKKMLRRSYWEIGTVNFK